MSGPAYAIEPRDPWLEATHAALAREIRPGNTVTFAVEIDLTGVEASRASAAAAGGGMPSYTAFVVEAVARALRDFPYANRRVFRRGFPVPGPRLQKFLRQDVAVAVASDAPGAEYHAVVAIVREADRLSPVAITAALDDPKTLVSEARGGRPPWADPVRWVETRGGAAIVGAAGQIEADAVIGTWSYPVGVAFGRVEPRAVVLDGAIVARPMCTLTLNFDRRVMAGAQAARFFRRLVERLEGEGIKSSPVETPAAAVRER